MGSMQTFKVKTKTQPYADTKMGSKQSKTKKSSNSNQKSIKEILANVQLIKQDGSTISGSEALADKKKVLVYFSAHWCPPCRMFTPVLKEAYEDELKDKKIEIVFVSSDQNEQGAKSYFNESHGNYLLAPHGCVEGDHSVKYAVYLAFRVWPCLAKMEC